MAAFDLVLARELGIQDPTYTSLPLIRKMLQAWILEYVGFKIGNVNASDIGERQSAEANLTKAKAAFYRSWEGRKE